MSLATEEDDVENYYSHSHVHCAVARADYTSLERILASLPRLPKAGEVTTEEESIRAEEKAEMVSSVIDRRDVPGRETALHLAVRLGDKRAVEMLMGAGADWSLQNEQGWSALQEAVCAREDDIAMTITRYYQAMAWAKWCRRLPRITAAMRRMRDFYMEITFNFESSVIPFISRIAPSDTYRIWKRGSNLRADMTLAGFDGFKIQRADQSFLFLGEGSEDGKYHPGSLLVLTHKDKEVTDALEGAGAPPSEAEIAQEVAAMSRTNMYRPGIDVTEAELCPQLSWRRQEKSETVGPWKAKVYDMNNVMVSIKSRRVPGAMSDEELFNAEAERNEEDLGGGDETTTTHDLLTVEERLQLEKALTVNDIDELDEEETLEVDHHEKETTETKNRTDLKNGSSSTSTSSLKEEKKGWLPWVRKSRKNEHEKHEKHEKNEKQEKRMNGKANSNHPLSLNGEALLEEPKRVSKSGFDSSSRISTESRTSEESIVNGNKAKDGMVKRTGSMKTVSVKKRMPPNGSSSNSIENEYKKGLKPVLWLTREFPLKTEELLPLLDVLANKVKAVRRLRELLTTKLPPGTFPVKIAIPVVPTIRVMVTFTKFEEFRSNEEFCTPLSSPAHFPQEEKNSEEENQTVSSSSWLSWIRGQQQQYQNMIGASTSSGLEKELEDEFDPFTIPPNYSWVDMNEKRRRMKAKKSKTNKKGKKSLHKSASDGSEISNADDNSNSNSNNNNNNNNNINNSGGMF